MGRGEAWTHKVHMDALPIRLQGAATSAFPLLRFLALYHSAGHFRLRLNVCFGPYYTEALLTMAP